MFETFKLGARRLGLMGAVLALAGCAAQVGSEPEEQAQATAAALDAVDGHGRPEPPMLGLHLAHDARPSGGGSSPLMTWHSGDIMTSSAATAIFWGTSWASSSFVGDKVTGVASFYTGYGDSNYSKTSTEYKGNNAGSSNVNVGTAVSYDGSITDTSAAPMKPPQTTTSVLNEVCKVITNPVANGYYAVYADTRRGNARYCAWHSYGTCNGVPVQFALFLNLDGDPGCDPQDTSGLHSQGLAALANVSAHELAEAMTDPRNGGWYDSSGGENGDKCAWTFNVPTVTFSDGTSWKVQGEWSNAAYNANTGYSNSSGQKGCLDGK